MGSSATWALLLAVFLAAIVEFVEALTIVLAMGITRGWRSALAGTAAAVVALAAFTAAAGYAITTWLPESALQLTVGTLLLIFGLQWLRKAILRSSGLKAMHDEAQIFDKQRQAAQAARPESRFGLDWFGAVVSFKGVFLEGVEIVFIVITFGLNAHKVPAAIGLSAGREATGRSWWSWASGLPSPGCSCWPSAGGRQQGLAPTPALPWTPRPSPRGHDAAIRQGSRPVLVRLHHR